MFDFDPGIGFFEGFSQGALWDRLTVFEKPGGQRPLPITGFNRAFAQQDFIVMDRETTRDDSRILIMDQITMAADKALPRIALGDSLGDCAAALATIFHASMIKVCVGASQGGGPL